MKLLCLLCAGTVHEPIGHRQVGGDYQNRGSLSHESIALNNANALPSKSPLQGGWGYLVWSFYQRRPSLFF